MESTRSERCIIITNYLQGNIRDLIDIQEDDVILCADGGYVNATAEGIKPSRVIGDFDSRSSFNREDVPDDIPVEPWSSHKDYTDTALCLDWAIEHGYRNILVIGGFGGREDHTIANLQNLFLFAKQGASVMMVDRQNLAFPLIDGEVTLEGRDGWYLSVFAHSEKAEGVTLRGVEYPLEDHTLTNDFPLGVCNEPTGDEVYIKVEKGELLIMMTRDLS